MAGSYSGLFIGYSRFVTSDFGGFAKSLDVFSSLAGNLVSSMTSSSSIASFPALSFPSGSSSDNVVVPSFISIYCTLGNSALSIPAIVGAPSLLDACGAMSRSLSTFTQRSISSFSLGSSILPHWFLGPLHRPFVVGPGYSPIPEKLLTKNKTVS